jgi:hypothetical protein
VNEYPLLCLRGQDCRRDTDGGPRRTHQSWLCYTCTDHLRTNLRFIADSWEDLGDALTASEAPEGEKGKQKHGMVAVGTNINEKVIAARTKATELVWFIMGVLRDDYDDAGRTFNPPNLPIDRLARWLSDWHVDHLAAGTSDETAVEVANDTATAMRAVRNAAYPSGIYWVEVGLSCERHGTSDMGERVPCDGEMRALVGRGAGVPDLVCSSDETHTIEPAVWERMGWKRAHRNLNPEGVANLTRRLAT